MRSNAVVVVVVVVLVLVVDERSNNGDAEADADASKRAAIAEEEEEEGRRFMMNDEMRLIRVRVRYRTVDYAFATLCVLLPMAKLLYTTYVYTSASCSVPHMILPRWTDVRSMLCIFTILYCTDSVV